MERKWKLLHYSRFRVHGDGCAELTFPPNCCVEGLGSRICGVKVWTVSVRVVRIFRMKLLRFWVKGFVSEYTYLGLPIPQNGVKGLGGSG